MKLSFIAFLGSILICGLASVSGWAGFKNLPPEKREQLKRIAIAQGLHVDKHVQEMQAAPVRVRRSACGGGSYGGGGTGRGGSSVGRGVGGGIGSRGGGGGGVSVMETIVVTGRRLPPVSSSVDFSLRGFQPPRRFGGGGGSSAANPPKPKEPQEPPEDPEAKKMTLQQFVFALEQLEKAFPNLPADQMANKLRMLVGRYDSPLWKVMLNVNVPVVGKDVSPFDKNTNPQSFQTLTQMLDHRIQNGAELGVVKINGDTVAFGHVITGATAGYDQQTVFGMNNLFSTTISGDLGQSALANSKNPASPIIGPAGQWQNGKYMLPSDGGFATHAEVLGDIDGFNMGKRIQANPAKPLSQHMKEYYGGESSQRFDIFKQHTTKAELTQEVYRFANLYEYKNDGLLSSVLQNASPDLAVRRASEINGIANTAVGAFCSRYSAQLGSWC
ncbi:uncharacterized protein LOC135494606 [Lineus longissimus]|uniref:uncharacterized protein LOC135494606 n=1 Tax=Lineus longissimus TaxID=88925 RepID=UPI002B4F5D05